MRNWDELKQENSSFFRKRTQGLCISCPEAYAGEEISIPETKATHRHFPCEPMCEKCFEKTIAVVEAICKTKWTQKEKDKCRVK